MKIRFFRIPIDGGPAEDALNQVLSTGHVRDIVKQLVPERDTMVWAVAVTVVPGEAGHRAALSLGRKGVDYKEVLTPADFEAYSALRALRKEWAARDGVPSYHVATNEQLAAMATKRPRTLQAMGTIEGFGPARMEKYGQALLDALASTPGSGGTEST